MNLDTFNACIEGYRDRLFDNQLLAVHSGFWSGYYTNTKRPKQLSTIIDSLVRDKDKEFKKHANEVDVDEFLRREAEFQKKLAAQESEE